MTRVLLVYHDIDVADLEADELRRAGYEVDRCAGPMGGDPCPILDGGPCWQVEKADVLVYDTWDVRHGTTDLVTELHALHPDKPLVVTSPEGAADRTSAREPGSAPVVHAPTRATLVPAIERAIRTAADPALGAATRSRREAHPHAGPRW